MKRRRERRRRSGFKTEAVSRGEEKGVGEVTARRDRKGMVDEGDDGGGNRKGGQRKLIKGFVSLMG